jgi:truncated hemoglobin YjbI
MTSPLVTTLILAISFQTGPDEDDTPPPARETMEITVVRNANQQTQRLSAFFPPADGQNNAGRGQVRRRLRDAVLDPENFDRWIFATALSRDDQQRHLKDLLERKVDNASRTTRSRRPSSRN